MNDGEQIREFMKRGQEAQKAVDKILKDQPCKACGGSGKEPSICPFHKVPFLDCGCFHRPTHPSAKAPCPNCKGTGIEPESEPTESRKFVKNIKDALEIIGNDGKFHRKIMEKAIAIIDTQQAENERQLQVIGEVAIARDELQAENKRLKIALTRIDMIEDGCKLRGVGFDIEIHRIATQALSEDK